MIKANFNAYSSYITDSLYQWDKNQDLIISGLNLTVAPEIHFTNIKMDRAVVRQSTLNNGIVTVRIPNSFLQSRYSIKAYVGIYEGETFKIIEMIEIPIIARTKPSDYTIEDDEEIYSFNRLENIIANKVLELESYTDTTIGNLGDRVDNIIAHNNDTNGNSELIDLRVDVDGTTHSSAGTAIRSQISKLVNNIGDKVSQTTFNTTIAELENVIDNNVDKATYNLDKTHIESQIDDKVLTYRVVGNKVNLNGVDQTYTQLYNACVTGDKAIYLRNGDNNNEIYHLHKVEGSGIGNAIVFSATFGNENRQISIYNRGPAGIEIMITLPAIFLTSADVDQTYSPTSTNALSGVAFAGVIDNMVSQDLYIPEKRAILSAIQTSNQNLADLSDKLSELSDIAIKYKNSNNVVTSWEDVQRIVRAGLAQDVFEIGEQLVCNHATYGTMVWNVIGIDQENVDGTEYNHSLTLQLDRIISNNITFKAFDSTGVTNSWEISQIRDWLNSTFFDGLDSDFKSVIAQTTKITGDTQTQDKMFLLSKQEVGISGYKFYQEDNRNRLFARGSYWILRTSAGVERTNGWLLVDLVLNHNYTTQTIGNTAVQSPRGIVPACCIM